MPEMQEIANTNPDPQYQLKIDLLKFAETLKKDAGNGVQVSQKQLSKYLDYFQKVVDKEIGKPTLSNEVREWVLSNGGIFSSTDVIKEMNLTTRAHKKNLTMIMARLVEEGLIAKHGDKRGQFRAIDRTMAPMNWQEADVDNTVDLVLPLGLHKLMKLYPKNIIVIAGDTNAGKTAYLLNLVRENAEKFSINYFTNDLTQEELKIRVSRFAEAGMNTEPFTACNFIPRNDNFLDVINPDGVTIIDYLKLTDKFWLVAKEIDKIYERLQKGVAIIAIQKDKNAAMGRGGDFAAEAARLYFTLERGRVNVVKMKNLIDPDKDPNEKSVKFSLWAGCKFIPDLEKGWHDTPKKYGGPGKQAKKEKPAPQRQPGGDDDLPF